MSEEQRILKAIQESGGQPFLIGGAVRDGLLGLDSKDRDFEVFAMSADSLAEILAPFGRVDLVGKSFGVIKLWSEATDFDFTLPRRENKSGKGHKGFMVEVDETMTPREAASRRDFTWNSLAQNPFTKEIVDFFGGQQDLEARILRHTSDAFAEDPLRVLRGMQFAGRFNMTVCLETAKLCKSLINEFEDLPTERVWVEWEKWASRSKVPSRGLEFLDATDWLELFPELQAIRNTLQDSQHHPEGDVWNHTLEVVDAATRIGDRGELNKEDRMVLVFAALCHDFGKSTTTESENGRITSKGHSKESAKFAESFLVSIGAPSWLIEKVKPLVREHMVLTNAITEKSVRRLANRLQPATITELLQVIESDQNGRGSMPKGLGENGHKLAELARQQAVENGKPRALLMGRHLLEMMSPGPQMGQLLKAAFEAQLDGAFSNLDGAMSWAERSIG